MSKVTIDRELLEQIAVELEHDNDRYMLGREIRTILAQPAQQGEAVEVAPDGYVVVPVEPTPEMAAQTAYDGKQYSDPFDFDDFRKDYAAMLAAAPAPVVPEVPALWSKSLGFCWAADADYPEGDWIVGTVDEDGNRYEVLRVEASQYDAEGESQKIAEAIVKLWAFAAAPAQDVAGWIPVTERLPSRRQPVLACYTNGYGRGRTIRAQWLAKFQQESDDIDNFYAEYDEETDTYYDPEGWYELIDNWGEYSSVGVTEGTITHWMPLPAAPALAASVEGGE